MESYGINNAYRRDVAVFSGDNVQKDTFNAAKVWRKPTGMRAAGIYLAGAGGRGGSGTIGAAGAAGGGGGGGSGAYTYIIVPAAMMPDAIWILLGDGGTDTNDHSYIGVGQYANWKSDQNYVLSYAEAGAQGGDASGGTAGSAGNGGGAATASKMPLGWNFAKYASGGNNGSAGGGSGNGANLSLPTTGIRMTGGMGGGGVPSSGNGGNGGGIIAPSQPTLFPSPSGGAGSTASTTPPGIGADGVCVAALGNYWYGGTGGGATRSNATGAGLVQARGGNGSIGCGGGGSGGALTGSIAAARSRGGPGFCVITWW